MKSSVGGAAANVVMTHAFPEMEPGMLRFSGKLIIASLLALALPSASRGQTTFPTANGSSVPGAVMMCLDSATGLAAPVLVSGGTCPGSGGGGGGSVTQGTVPWITQLGLPTPSLNPTANSNLATWVLATGTTNVDIPLSGSVPNVEVGVTVNGTVSAGQITMRCKDSTGSYVTLPVGQSLNVGLAAQAPVTANPPPPGLNTYVLVTQTCQILNVALTTGITGTGNIVISYTLSPNPVVPLAITFPFVAGSGTTVVGGFYIGGVGSVATTAPISTLNSSNGAGSVPSAEACVFDDVAPTALTENNFGFARCSANRNRFFSLRDAAGNERGQNINANNAALVAVDQTTPGTTNGSSPVAAALGGATQHSIIAANSNNCTNIKASAGTAYLGQLYSIGAASAWFKLYDKATTPSAADTPVGRILIPANSTAALGAGSLFASHVGKAFTLGIGYCLVTGIADNDNTSVPASTFVVNIDWK